MRGSLAVAAILVGLQICGCNSDQGTQKRSDLPIDTTGWSPSGTNHWRNARGGELQILASSTPSLTRAGVEPFRNTMRSEILGRGGALISAELSPTGVGTVIGKFPQQPSGMTYEGLVVFARNDTEYRVSVRFPETGVTGVRDTLVFSLHMKGISSDADPTEGWMMDPYDRDRRDPLMRNGADDEQHDSKFPDHPLTLVRAEVRRLVASL